MKQCRHCGIKIASDLPRCPLCDMETAALDADFAADYPYVKSRFTRSLTVRLVTFLAIVVAGLSFFINHLVPSDSPWVYITAVAIVYVWISMINLVSNLRNPGSVILCQLLSASGLLFGIDFLTGWHKWSVNYVIPFLIIGAALGIVLCMLIRPLKFRAYTIYQLMIAVLGVLSLLLWFFGAADVEWPVEAAAIFSLLCFLSMLVFADRRTRNELHKRFHI